MAGCSERRREGVMHGWVESKVNGLVDGLTSCL